MSLIQQASSSAPREYCIQDWGSLNSDERERVQEIYARHIKTGSFVPRPRAKIEKGKQGVWEDPETTILRRCFVIMNEARTIMGGISIIKEGAWAELTRLFVEEEYQGQGLSDSLIQHCLEEARQHLIFAVTKSPQASRVFERNGFMPRGSIPDIQKNVTSSTWPARIQKYPHPERKPYVFVHYPDDDNEGNRTATTNTPFSYSKLVDRVDARSSIDVPASNAD